MKPIKQLTQKFLFLTVMIFCLVMLLCGSTTVKERTGYNMYLDKYSTVSVTTAEKNVSVKLDKNKYTFDTHNHHTMINNDKTVSFSPFGSSYYLFKTLNRLFG